MENKANVLITGAGGFVGKVLTKLLVEQGYKVKALIRNRPVGFSHPNLEEIMVPDLIDLDRALLEGIEVVIHLAAHVHQMAQVKQHKKTYYQVNLDITSKLAEMVANSSVQQFIYLSTIKVNGEATAYNQSFNVIDEPCPQDDYAKSKYLAELKLQEILAQSAVAYTIIRAPLVYGPGAVGNYEHLAKLVQKNSLLLWPLGGIKNKRSLIHVNYLSTCIEQAILNPAVYNQLLLLSDGKDISTPELIKYIAFLSKKEVTLFNIPPAVLKWLARLAGKQDQYQKLTSNLQIDSHQSKALLHGME